MGDASRQKRLAPNSKRASVLRTLLDRGARGLSCFEAVTACHDFVLRSTISSLCSVYALEIPRRLESVPGYAGSKVEACRYTLSDQDRANARELLGMVPEDIPEPSAHGNALTQAEQQRQTGREGRARAS